MDISSRTQVITKSGTGFIFYLDLSHANLIAIKQIPKLCIQSVYVYCVVSQWPTAAVHAIGLTESDARMS